MDGLMDLAAMQKMPADTLSKPSAFDQAALDEHRKFFALWEEFHAMANDQLHRKKKEETAQRMVDQAHLLRAMRGDRPTLKVNGRNGN
jgi:Na+/phosphate symporter